QDDLQHHAYVISYNLDKYGLDWIIRSSEVTLAEQLVDQRIYSLSKRCDNLHLWQAYAANHRGYCLEFRRSELFAAAMEVRYQSRVAFDGTAEHASAAFYFYKRRKWFPEQELRIVLPRSKERYMPFNPKLLKRIFMGQHMTPENQNVI